MKLSGHFWVLVPLAAAGAFAGCAVQIDSATSSSDGTTATVTATSTGTGGAGGFGGGGTTGTTSASSGGMGDIAAACASDADCFNGLSCLSDTADDPVFGGGPAGGFCTQVCNGDVDCSGLGGVCFKVDPQQPGRCTLACTVGPAITSVDGLFSPLDPGKCHGREDLRCAGSSTGVCLPTCGDDSQCQLGRKCDPRRSVCVDKPSMGDAIGAKCDPTASTNSCAGVCIGFTSGVAMCSKPCVLGGAEIATADCGGPEHGLCAFRPTPDGPGDTGFCTPACANASDCHGVNDSFWCFSVPGVTEMVQKGYCFAAQSCTTQADCVAQNDANYVCTATATGSFCLDPKFLP